MQRTTVAERLASGEAVLGARTTTMSPSMVEVYGTLGFDFTWLDFEHIGGSPYDADLLEQYTRAADVADVDLLVRLPRGDPVAVRKALDTSVRTLLVPQVKGVERLPSRHRGRPVRIRRPVRRARRRYRTRERLGR